MAPIDFWQNSTSFLVRQQSVQQKLTVLEDEHMKIIQKKTKDEFRTYTTVSLLILFITRVYRVNHLPTYHFLGSLKPAIFVNIVPCNWHELSSSQ